MFSGHFTICSKYMQVLLVILAGKGQNDLEMYQGNQYLKE